MISTRGVVAAAAVAATLTGTAGALAAPDRPHGTTNRSVLVDVAERLGVPAQRGEVRYGLPEHHWGDGPRGAHHCGRRDGADRSERSAQY